MQPEHEAFLLDHVRQMGFFLIIDRLKEHFRGLTHDQACAIYDEFRAKHADQAAIKSADAQLKAVGRKIGGDIEKALKQLGKDTSAKEEQERCEECPLDLGDGTAQLMVENHASARRLSREP